MSCGWLCR